eukprot:Hpha_TRINITY_DN18924_c0_g1::TRINITY_DN18924_c0_g1_i1::g.17435::m.17435
MAGGSGRRICALVTVAGAVSLLVLLINSFGAADHRQRRRARRYSSEVLLNQPVSPREPMSRGSVSNGRRGKSASRSVGNPRRTLSPQTPPAQQTPSPGPSSCRWDEVPARAGLTGMGEYQWAGDAAAKTGQGGEWRKRGAEADAAEVRALQGKNHEQRNQDPKLNNDKRGWMLEFAALDGVLQSTKVGAPLVWRDSATGLRVALVQMLTHAEPTVCSLIRIALERGWPLNLVGFGEDLKRARDIGWMRGVGRQAVLGDATASIPDDVVVFVSDSFDVVLQDSPSEFAARWVRHEHQKGQGTVLYSAEMGCWPFGLLRDGCPEWPGGCSRFPPSRHGPRRPRYLNAGAFAARAKDLKVWFNGLANLSTSTPRRCLYDDQAPHGWHWVQTHERTKKALLDHDEFLVKNTNCVASELRYSSKHGRFLHSRGASEEFPHPLAVHTNGDKRPLGYFIQSLSSRETAPPPGCVTVDGVLKDYTGVCGKLPIRPGNPPPDRDHYRYTYGCNLP